MRRGERVIQGQAFSNFQEQHHHVIRNGERFPAVVKYTKSQDGQDVEDESDSDDDVKAPVTSERPSLNQETPNENSHKSAVEDTQSNSQDDGDPNVNAHQSYEEGKSDKELEEELLERIRSLRDIYNGKVSKHRQRRAAGESIGIEEEAAVMAELKNLRAEYYQMVTQVKKIRARQNQGSETGMETRRQNRFERHRQAQRIQEEKHASKQLTDRFLKGEHRNIRDAAVVDDYPREDEIAKSDSG